MKAGGGLDRKPVTAAGEDIVSDPALRRVEDAFRQGEGTMTETRYLYSGDREAVELDDRRFYFRDLAELEEVLFLAGYGEADIARIELSVELARENGWGHSFDDERRPCPPPADASWATVLAAAGAVLLIAIALGALLADALRWLWVAWLR